MPSTNIRAVNPLAMSATQFTPLSYSSTFSYPFSTVPLGVVDLTGNMTLSTPANTPTNSEFQLLLRNTSGGSVTVTPSAGWLGTSGTTLSPITVPAGASSLLILTTVSATSVSASVSGSGSSTGTPITSGQTADTAITDGQNTTSTAFVDVTGASVTLPGAGTYEIEYNIFINNNTASQTNITVLTDASNNPVPGTYATMSEAQGAAFTGANYGRAEVTVTGPTTYKVRWRVTGGQGIIGNSANNGSSWVRFRQQPTGTSVPSESVPVAPMHRVRLRRDAAFAIPANAITPIPFDTAEYNVGNIGNTTTGAVTIAQSGLYHLYAKYYPQTQTLNSQVTLLVNGTPVSRSLVLGAGTSTSTQEAEATLQLNVNDIVTATVFSNAANSTSTTADDRPILEVIQQSTLSVVSGVSTTGGVAAWAGSTAVVADELRSRTIFGVEATIRNTGGARTTAATFTEAEAANWRVIAQTQVPALNDYVSGVVIPRNFEIEVGSRSYFANAGGITTTSSFYADRLISYWVQNASGYVPHSGNAINFGNVTASGTLAFPGAAQAQIDDFTHLYFAQTTANVVASLPSASPLRGRTWMLDNTAGTVPIVVTGVAAGSDLVIVPAGGTARIAWTPAQNRYVADSPAQVQAEFGETVLTNDTTLNSTSTYQTLMTFTLPSAGTWEVEQQVGVNTGAAGRGAQTQIFDSAGAALPTSNIYHAFNGVGAEIVVAGSGTVRITTVSAATFTVRGIAILQTGSTVYGGGRTRVSWKKISGLTPVTGQIVDDVQVTLSNGTAIANNAPMIFDQINTGNIPYSTTTGDFTLSAGKRYRLSANVFTASNSAWEWRTSAGVSLSPTQNANTTGTIELIFTPSATTLVRLVNSSGVAATPNAGRNTAIVQQLGSTATTTTTKAIVRASNNTSQSIPINAATTVTGWSETIDTLGAFNPATGVFTAPRAMRVEVSASLLFASAPWAGNEISASIRRNGSATASSGVFVQAAGTFRVSTGRAFDILDLAVGDTVDVTAFHDAGSARSLGGSATFTTLTIEEIEPTY